MSRLLRALEKVGLVETDAHEQSGPAVAVEQAPEVASQAADAEHPVAPEGEMVNAPAVDLAEPRSFEDIYGSAGLADAPFPAEKLLKILEGLAALEPASRKAAVMALDAADDAWSIDDALQDAEHKIEALDLARKQVETQARDALLHARGEIEAREQRKQEAVTRIRQQIADLEALLEREVKRAAEEVAAIEESGRATKAACKRESDRYNVETLRLRRLAQIFAPAPDQSAQS